MENEQKKKAFRDYSNYFKKTYNRLPERIKRKFERVVFELEDNSLGRGRKRRNIKDCRCSTVRIDRSYRLAFREHDDNTIELLAAGKRNDVYEYLKNKAESKIAGEIKSRIRNRT